MTLTWAISVAWGEGESLGDTERCEWGARGKGTG